MSERDMQVSWESCSLMSGYISKAALAGAAAVVDDPLALDRLID